MKDSTADKEFRFKLLGGFSLCDSHGAEILKFAASRPDEVLAYVLVRAAEGQLRVSRAEIAAQVWRESESDRPRSILRQVLPDLKKELQEHAGLLVIDKKNVSIDLARVSVDYEEFRAAVRAAASSKESAEPHHRSVVELYGGELLPGIGGTWSHSRRAIDQRDFAVSFEALLDAVSKRDVDEALNIALCHVRREPTSESANRWAINLYAKLGRVREATAHYKHFAVAYRLELDATPPGDIIKTVFQLQGKSNGTPVLEGTAQSAASMMDEDPVAPSDGNIDLQLPTPTEGARLIRGSNREGALSDPIPQMNPESPLITARHSLWKPALAAAFLIALVAVVVFTLERSLLAKGPPPTPDERVSIIESLSRTEYRETPGQNDYRHAQIAEQVVALGEEAYLSWYRREESAWFTRLASIDPQIDRTMDWLTTHVPERALQLGGALSRYWGCHTRRDKPQRWLGLALTKCSGGRREYRARALAAYGVSLLNPEEESREAQIRDDMKGIAEETKAIKLYDDLKDRYGYANATRLRGHLYRGLDRNQEAARDFREALTIFEKEGYVPGRAYTLWSLSVVPSAFGPPKKVDHIAPIKLLVRSLREWRGIGNEWNSELTFTDLVDRTAGLLTRIDLRRRDDMPALLCDVREECLSELALARVSSNRGTRFKTHILLAKIALRLGDRKEAVEQLAHVIQAMNDLEPIITLGGVFLAHAQSAGASAIPRQQVDQLLSSLRRTWSPSLPPFDRLIARGKVMSLESAIAFAHSPE